MIIEKRKKYRIKGKSEYFKKKYGTYNPVIRIEDQDINIWKGGWGVQNENPACMLYGIRAGIEKIGWGRVFYGHIESLGELVEESELEEIDGV